MAKAVGTSSVGDGVHDVHTGADKVAGLAGIDATAERAGISHQQRAVLSRLQVEERPGQNRIAGRRLEEATGRTAQAENFSFDTFVGIKPPTSRDASATAPVLFTGCPPYKTVVPGCPITPASAGVVEIGELVTSGGEVSPVSHHNRYSPRT